MLELDNFFKKMKKYSKNNSKYYNFIRLSSLLLPIVQGVKRKVLYLSGGERELQQKTVYSEY